MSQPFGSEPAPQSHAQQHDNAADHNQEFSEFAHFCRKVARIARRHKVEARWQCSSEIITKRLAFPKRRPRTRSGVRFGNWRANIIPTSPRTKKLPRKNLSRSMKPMKS